MPVTSGCSNHSCTFCNYFQGAKLRIRDVEDVKKEIDALALYARYGVGVPAMPGIVYAMAREWDGKRVFLQDGDALVYPFPRLVEVLRYLGEKLPFVERVAAYATPRDVLRRSVDELRQLRELKLGIVYMGVESGDEEVLKKVRKGVGYGEIVAAGRRAREAGIALSVTVILGLAGVEGSEKHARETARILSAIDPNYAGALTLMPVPGTPIYDQVRRGELHLLSPLQSLEELKIIIENASFSRCLFSSMHASNYFAIRGPLPKGKELMLRNLQAVLNSGDPALLRPESMRGL